MKILFLEWDSFANKDMIDAFISQGLEVKCIPFSNEEVRGGEKTEKYITENIRFFSPDFVFSFNYFPIVSIACKKNDMIYVSWTYDNPYVLLYSYTILYEKNYIFVFDKELFMEYHNAGIKTVHYLPLAANPKRLSAVSTKTPSNISKIKPLHDVSFVGSLYTEKHDFYSRLDGINSYTKGYLEGLMNAQMQVYGYNFIQESITKDILDEMSRVLPLYPNADGIETSEYLYAQYVINRQITSLERIRYLTSVAENFGLDLYTPSSDLSITECKNHGTVNPYNETPYVFSHSKINLNISLRSIKSGIPLRCFEIIGSNGFLLTNYQADFDDCFVSGQDYIYYENQKDMLEKISYFLTNENERAAIKENGFHRLSENHTFEHRVKEILSYILCQ